MKNSLLIILIIAMSALSSWGQVTTLDSLPKENLNWYNKSAVLDNIYGASVDQAYNVILKDKTPSSKIIVAVIDGGVDISHPDLQGKIWTNSKEIEGNGIDDDKNGYTDDIHGWNFIGNKKGENINYEVYEQVRMIRAFDIEFSKFSNVDQVPENQKKDYLMYEACKKDVKEKTDKALARKKNIEELEENLSFCEKVLTDYLGKSSYTPDEICGIENAPEKVMGARNFMCNRYRQGFSYKELQGLKERTAALLDMQLNKDFNPRSIIGDNPLDINDKNYGNNDVTGPASDHGTFVAGIIAAKRNNNIGTNGIAENVEIMVIRVVPNGDERDKDVALGIRYAVDNGARIINMSFGKDYSPQKKFVDEAIEYAEQHNVLLVHAAGNNSADIDATPRFPTKVTEQGKEIKTWVNVGANSRIKNKNFCGVFTNYGQTKVDLYAPGVDIISLAPGNKYKLSSGTSFSCPVVSGVAALILSYYPGLTAIQLEEILLSSATNLGKTKVYIPSTGSNKKKKARFRKLSITGGIVNAEQALKLAGAK